ncbi:MAG: hypothetical protein ABFR82_16390 [Nitrospirota bacterium]|jgi:hypothetical protein
MKKQIRSTTYKRYKSGQIKLAATEDSILILAKKLVRAKDKEGINLFWNKNEEEFMREYIESSEELCRC